MKVAFGAIGLALILEANCPFAQAATSDVIKTLSAKVETMYVDPVLATEAAAHVRSEFERGAYRDCGAAELATTLTNDLRRITGDGHFQVRYSAEQYESLTGPAGSILPRTALLREARERNFGFTAFRLLEGNIAYLKLDTFSWEQGAEEKAHAVMSAIADAYAIIIDLRDNRGGNSAMTQLLMAYLFEGDLDQPLQTFEKRYSDWTYEMMPLASVPGRRLTTLPIFILVSSRTWSAGEELAYLLQVRKRATIVGEKTVGGANGIEFVPLVDNFVLKIPSIRSVDTVTNTNWQGTGIKPDRPCPGTEALEHAHLLAIEALIKRTDGTRKRQLGLLREKIAARGRSSEPLGSQLRQFAGSYGGHRLKYEQGALWFRPRGGAEADWRQLTPLGDDAFMIDGINDWKLSLAKRDGKVCAIVTFADGREKVVPRDD